MAEKKRSGFQHFEAVGARSCIESTYAPINYTRYKFQFDISHRARIGVALLQSSQSFLLSSLHEFQELLFRTRVLATFEACS